MWRFVLYRLFLAFYFIKFSILKGTLIKRNVILTAAHCIYKEVDFTYNGVENTTSVEPNSYYPTENSMFKVFLGLQNRNETSNAVEVPVSKIIVVSCFFLVKFKVNG